MNDVFPDGGLKSGRAEVMISTENVLPDLTALSQHPQLLPGQDIIEIVNVVIMLSSLHFLWVVLGCQFPAPIISKNFKQA